MKSNFKRAIASISTIALAASTFTGFSITVNAARGTEVSFASTSKFSVADDGVTWTSNSGSGTNNACAVADLSNIKGIHDDYAKITITFNATVFDQGRMMVGIGDKDVRGTNANGSKSGYNTTGLSAWFGLDNGNHQYKVSGQTIPNAPFGQEVHAEYVLDKTNGNSGAYTLTITNVNTGAQVANVNGNAENADVVELFSWTGDTSAKITSVRVNVVDNTPDPTATPAYNLESDVEPKDYGVDSIDYGVGAEQTTKAYWSADSDTDAVTFEEPRAGVHYKEIENADKHEYPVNRIVLPITKENTSSSATTLYILTNVPPLRSMQYEDDASGAFYRVDTSEGKQVKSFQDVENEIFGHQDALINLQDAPETLLNDPRVVARITVSAARNDKNYYTVTAGGAGILADAAGNALAAGVSLPASNVYYVDSSERDGFGNPLLDENGEPVKGYKAFVLPIVVNTNVVRNNVTGQDENAYTSAFGNKQDLLVYSYDWLGSFGPLKTDFRTPDENANVTAITYDLHDYNANFAGIGTEDYYQDHEEGIYYIGRANTNGLETITVNCGRVAAADTIVKVFALTNKISGDWLKDFLHDYTHNEEVIDGKVHSGYYENVKWNELGEAAVTAGGAAVISGKDDDESSAPGPKYIYAVVMKMVPANTSGSDITNTGVDPYPINSVTYGYKSNRYQNAIMAEFYILNTEVQNVIEPVDFYGYKLRDDYAAYKRWLANRVNLIKQYERLGKTEDVFTKYASKWAKILDEYEAMKDIVEPVQNVITATKAAAKAAYDASNDVDKELKTLLDYYTDDADTAKPKTKDRRDANAKNLRDQVSGIYRTYEIVSNTAKQYVANNNLSELQEAYGYLVDFYNNVIDEYNTNINAVYDTENKKLKVDKDSYIDNIQNLYKLNDLVYGFVLNGGRYQLDDPTNAMYAYDVNTLSAETYAKDLAKAINPAKGGLDVKAIVDEINSENNMVKIINDAAKAFKAEYDKFMAEYENTANDPAEVIKKYKSLTDLAKKINDAVVKDELGNEVNTYYKDLIRDAIGNDVERGGKNRVDYLLNLFNRVELVRVAKDYIKKADEAAKIINTGDVDGISSESYDGFIEPYWAAAEARVAFDDLCAAYPEFDSILKTTGLDQDINGVVDPASGVVVKKGANRELEESWLFVQRASEIISANVRAEIEDIVDFTANNSVNKNGAVLNDDIYYPYVALLDYADLTNPNYNTAAGVAAFNAEYDALAKYFTKVKYARAQYDELVANHKHIDKFLGGWKDIQEDPDTADYPFAYFPFAQDYDYGTAATTTITAADRSNQEADAIGSGQGDTHIEMLLKAEAVCDRYSEDIQNKYDKLYGDYFDKLVDYVDTASYRDVVFNNFDDKYYEMAEVYNRLIKMSGLLSFKNGAVWADDTVLTATAAADVTATTIDNKRDSVTSLNYSNAGSNKSISREQLYKFRFIGVTPASEQANLGEFRAYFERYEKILDAITARLIYGDFSTSFNNNYDNRVAKNSLHKIVEGNIVYLDRMGNEIDLDDNKIYDERGREVGQIVDNRDGTFTANYVVNGVRLTYSTGNPVPDAGLGRYRTFIDFNGSKALVEESQDLHEAVQNVIDEIGNGNELTSRTQYVDVNGDVIEGAEGNGNSSWSAEGELAKDSTNGPTTIQDFYLNLGQQGRRNIEMVEDYIVRGTPNPSKAIDELLVKVEDALKAHRASVENYGAVYVAEGGHTITDYTSGSTTYDHPDTNHAPDYYFDLDTVYDGIYFTKDDADAWLLSLKPAIETALDARMGYDVKSIIDKILEIPGGELTTETYHEWDATVLPAHELIEVVREGTKAKIMDASIALTAPDGDPIERELTTSDSAKTYTLSTNGDVYNYYLDVWNAYVAVNEEVRQIIENKKAAAEDEVAEIDKLITDLFNDVANPVEEEGVYLIKDEVLRYNSIDDIQADIERLADIRTRIENDKIDADELYTYLKRNYFVYAFEDDKYDPMLWAIDSLLNDWLRCLPIYQDAKEAKANLDIVVKEYKTNATSNYEYPVYEIVTTIGDTKLYSKDWDFGYAIPTYEEIGDRFELVRNNVPNTSLIISAKPYDLTREAIQDLCDWYTDIYTPALVRYINPASEVPDNLNYNTVSDWEEQVKLLHDNKYSNVVPQYNANVKYEGPFNWYVYPALNELIAYNNDWREFANDDLVGTDPRYFGTATPINKIYELIEDFVRDDTLDQKINKLYDQIYVTRSSGWTDRDRGVNFTAQLANFQNLYNSGTATDAQILAQAQTIYAEYYALLLDNPDAVKYIDYALNEWYFEKVDSEFAEDTVNHPIYDWVNNVKNFYFGDYQNPWGQARVTAADQPVVQLNGNGVWEVIAGRTPSAEASERAWQTQLQNLLAAYDALPERARTLITDPSSAPNETTKKVAQQGHDAYKLLTEVLPDLHTLFVNGYNDAAKVSTAIGKANSFIDPVNIITAATYDDAKKAYDDAVELLNNLLAKYPDKQKYRAGVRDVITKAHIQNENPYVYDLLTNEEFYNDLTKIEDATIKLKSTLAPALAKVEAVNAVAALIDAIGNVTVDSGDAIAAATSAYEALTAEQQQQLAEKSKILDDAKTEYAKLEDVVAAKAAAEPIIRAINAIGDVTRNSGNAIDNARNAYNNANELVQSFVVNKSDLDAKIEEYARLTEANGDIVGDVGVGSDDIIKVLNHILGRDTLTDAQKKAVNIDQSNDTEDSIVIDVFDLIGMVKLWLAK